MKRFLYHFEPKKGWMNDPNGLIEFQGQYHAFFQHNPYDIKWGPMHWGHAVSKDLVHWEELPIALKPEEEYEDGGGCFSGSAIEKDGKLYLFYTSVSKRLGQTQSVAVSEDGIHFEKYKGNPVIAQVPADGSADFRDPKVSLIDGVYYMVVGSSFEGRGRVLLYRSESLYEWDYIGVLYESEDYYDAVECPDFFQMGDTYVLMYSKIGFPTYATQFITGDFDGKKFFPKVYSTPEAGPQFYAAQTFGAKDGRRILIGWLYDWKMVPDQTADSAGALSIPRELSLKDGKICCFPVKEAQSLLASYQGKDGEVLDVLWDEKAVEVFVNKGEHSFSYWLKN